MHNRQDCLQELGWHIYLLNLLHLNGVEGLGNYKPPGYLAVFKELVEDSFVFVLGPRHLALFFAGEKAGAVAAV